MASLSRLRKQLRKLEIELIYAQNPVTYPNRDGSPKVGTPDPAKVLALQKQIEYVNIDITDAMAQELRSFSFWL